MVAFYGLRNKRFPKLSQNHERNFKLINADEVFFNFTNLISWYILIYLRIQTNHEKIRTRKNSVFGLFSRSVYQFQIVLWQLILCGGNLEYQFNLGSYTGRSRSSY